jgi:hypothetical protein
MPLALSDQELDQVFRAAAPIAPHDRDAFLQDVAQRLTGITIGPGSVFRACHEAQRSFLNGNYPQFGSGHWSKHR